jgi:hypothetical protein
LEKIHQKEKEKIKVQKSSYFEGFQLPKVQDKRTNCQILMFGFQRIAKIIER